MSPKRRSKIFPMSKKGEANKPLPTNPLGATLFLLNLFSSTPLS